MNFGFLKRHVTLRTTLLLAAAMALLAVVVPVGVSAGTGSLVRIVDGDDATKIARVDATGHVLVGDGSGRITVNGAVDAAQGLPAHPWSTEVSAVGGAKQVYASASENTKLAIGSVTIRNNSSDAGTGYLFVRNQGCASDGGGSRLTFRVKGYEMLHLALPQPLVAPWTTVSGGWCLYVQTSTSMSVTLVGSLFPVPIVVLDTDQ